MDSGQLTICALMTESFLRYSKAQGNDLSTPHPEFGFDGLKEGDYWCLCASRWKQAYEDGMAPLVRLKATEISALQPIGLELLMQNSFKET